MLVPLAVAYALTHAPEVPHAVPMLMDTQH